MAEPFHFTTDPSLRWTAVDTIGSSTWTQAGSDLTASAGDFEGIFRRDTDTSNNATVEARQKHDWLQNDELFGVVCNVQGTTQWYLWIWQRFANHKVRLFSYNSGFTMLSDKNKAYTPGSYVRMKITSADNGSNKDLEGFVDEVSEATASTSFKLGAGNGGIMVRVKNPSSEMDVDWWALDTVLAINSVTPNSGLSDETTSVVIDGNDFGDGTLVDVGIQAAQNIVVVSPTQINCDFPPSVSGKVNVIVKFGTP